MVLLTVLTNSNDHTVVFYEPQEIFEFIRLIKCYLYNSWFNLKKKGEVTIFVDQNAAGVNVISPGNYTIKSMGKKGERWASKSNCLINETFDLSLWSAF